jgi:hypothetical protein
MTTHLVTSHGSDFFGEDRYPLRQLQDIADYVRGTIPAASAGPLVQLLAKAGAEPQSVAPEQAAEFAGQLLATIRNRFMKPKLTVPIQLLADAAARAADAGDLWTWTPAEA